MKKYRILNKEFCIVKESIVGLVLFVGQIPRLRHVPFGTWLRTLLR